MERTKKLKLLVAIYGASLLTQSVNAIGLILQGVIDTYPGTTVAAAQLIVSVAGLVCLIGTLIIGPLTRLATKKNLLAIAILFMSLGGLLGYFASNSLAMVYFACALAGFGVGWLVPLTSSLIAEYFDGSTRASIMGVQGVFVNCGGIAIQLIGGFLAAAYWKNLFLLYACFIVIDVIAFVLLPKGEVEKPVAGEKVKVFNRFLVLMMIQGFFMGMCMMVVTSNITMYVYELGIGNEAQAGIITTTFSIGAMIAGILLVFAMRAFKRYVFAVGMACGAAGLWIFATTGSLATFIAAAFIIGVGFTLQNTSFYTLVPSNASPAATTTSIGLYSGAMSTGLVVCPLVVTPIASMFGTSLSWCYVIGAAIVTLVAVFAFITPSLLKDYKLTLD